MPLEGPRSAVNQDPNSPSMVKVNMHVPSGYGMKSICALDSSLNGELKIARSDGTFSVMEMFWEDLNEEKSIIDSRLLSRAPMNKLTNKEHKQFRETKLCHICNQDLRPYILTAKDRISHHINKIQFYIRLEINNTVRTLVNGAEEMKSLLAFRMQELRSKLKENIKEGSNEALNKVVAEIKEQIRQYRESYQKYIRENKITILTTRELKKIETSEGIVDKWRNVVKVFQNGIAVENPHILNNAVPLVIKEC